MWRDGVDDPLERWDFVDLEMDDLYEERLQDRRIVVELLSNPSGRS